MNWKKEAENDLRSYERRLESLQNTAGRIRALRERMLAIRGGLSDAAPVPGGASGAQDRLIDCVAEIERLRHVRAAVGRLVRLAERGLEGLSPRERRVLELLYIRQQPDGADRLAEELGCGRTQLYRLRDEALYKFTVSLYGLTDY